jgi:hypothetical protein
VLDGKTKTYYKVEITPGWKSQRLRRCYPTIPYSQLLTTCFYIQALDLNPGYTVFLDPMIKMLKEYFEKAVTTSFGIHESSIYFR